MAIVAEAAIRISPQIATDFQQQLGRQLSGPLDSQAGVAGKRAGERLSKELGAATSRGATEAGQQAGSRFGRSFGGALTALGGLVVARRILSFFQGSITALAELEKVGAQTNAVLRSTGNVAGVSADHVADLANSVEDLTTVDNKAVQSAANLLLTFKGVQNVVGEGNDVFDQAVRSATDMSVALGTDLSGAALQLGKALNDPILGLTALRRSGVSFTQEQQDTIRALVDTGRQMEAQKLILAELNTEFGRSGEALGDTLAGDLNRAGDAVEELQIKTGKAIRPIVGFLGDVVGLAGEIPGPIIATGTAFAGLVATAAVVRGIGVAIKGNLLLPLERVTGRANLASKALRGIGIAGIAFAAAEGIDALAAGLNRLTKGPELGVQRLTSSLIDLSRGTSSTDFGRVQITVENLDAALAGLVESGHADEAALALEKLKQAANPRGIDPQGIGRLLLPKADVAVLSGELSKYQEALASVSNEARLAGPPLAGIKQDFIDQIDPLGLLTDKQHELAQTYDEGTQAITTFQGVLDRSLGRFISNREAAAGYEESVDRLKDALAENGRTFDIHTEKGRANQDALIGLVQASQELVDARVREGIVGADVAAQEADLTTILRGLQDRFPPLRTEISQYIGALDGIPPNVTTNVDIRLPPAGSVERDIAARIRRLEGTERSIGINFDIVPRSSGRSGQSASSALYVRPVGTAFPTTVRHGGGWITGAGREVSFVGEVGEFVLRRRSAQILGRPVLERLNAIASRREAAAILQPLRLQFPNLPRMHAGGALVGGGGSDPALLAAIERMNANVLRLLGRPAQFNINEVAQDPQATAVAVSTRLGLGATR